MIVIVLCHVFLWRDWNRLIDVHAIGLLIQGNSRRFTQYVESVKAILAAVVGSENIVGGTVSLDARNSNIATYRSSDIRLGMNSLNTAHPLCFRYRVTNVASVWISLKNSLRNICCATNVAQ